MNNKLQKLGGTLALAWALGGCGDPINNNNKFAQWTPQQSQAILDAHSVSELVKIPDLEKNIRKWVKDPYSTWDMQVMQTIKWGIAWVEQNSTVSIKFWEVKEGTYFARFTNPKNQNEYKDFAIVCANGMMRWMNNLKFSTPINIPRSTEWGNSTWIRLLSEEGWENVYTIPKGGSIIGSTGMTVEKAKQIARLLWLKSFYNKDGKYVVIVQPWDRISEFNDSNWQQYGYLPVNKQ